MTGSADLLPALARDVFLATYGAPTRAQELAWPEILAGRHALVVAPTGSGKTLAAFYAFLARMIEAPAEDGVELVYISPLKALAVDIERNLRAPLAALTREAHVRGITPSKVSVMVRTGDTPARERSAMQRRPPRILVTTPESLYLILTSPKGRDILRTARAVIIDEVHALIPTKRGVHLALSLERLERLAQAPLQRIGLSATIAPVAEAQSWLGGRAGDEAGERPVTVCDAGEQKPIDLLVIAPDDDAPSAGGARVGPTVRLWPQVAATAARIILAHRSTLIFCNNRRLAERLTALINEAAGAPLALSHHGSVARERRALVEEQLKNGELRAVVATGSLELGIDVGAVDCVIQIGSPKAVSRALQRIGRSGHIVGGIPKGRIIPTFRADYLETAAVARAVLARAVEPVRSPERCLDILAQQIVAEVAAAGREITPVRELFAMVRRAHPYRALVWEDFISVVEMLAGRHQVEALREMKPRLDWDRKRGRLAALPGSRVHATSRPGAIPDRGMYRVESEETRQRLGELDEEFVFESRVGEVFVLGATAWRIARIGKDRVVVRPAAPGEPARMPFWRGEGLGRTFEVGGELGRLVREIGARLPAPAGDDGVVGSAEPAADFAARECALDPVSARIVVEHITRQRDATGLLPDDRTIILEQYQDDLGDARVALLSPFGGRVHGAWAILLAAEARRRLGLDIPYAPTDDGILFRVPSGDIADRLLGAGDWLRSLDVPEQLAAEIEGTSLYAGLFRDAASRSLILSGRGKNGRVPLWLARLRAADIAQLMRGHPDFPVAREARREALEDVLDVRGLVTLLARIERDELRVLPVRRSLPSPFASSLQSAFTLSFLYEGDAPRLERRARALAAGPDVAASLLSPEELSDLLDPAAVAAVEARLQHVAPGTKARTPEELAEMLRRLLDLSDEEIAARYQGPAVAAIQELWTIGRTTRTTVHGRSVWTLDEDQELWRDALEPGRAAASPGTAARIARAEIVRRFAGVHAPFALAALVERYGFPEAELEAILAALVRDGIVAQGRFVRAEATTTYADRRNLAEAHRRTLALLRDRGAPARMADFAAFLLARHRAGDVGTAVQILSGVTIPRETFERDLLWRRVEPYQPALLDAACAAGEVSWWLDGTKLTVAPRAELATWYAPPASGASTPHEQAVLDALDARGAQFAPELIAASGLLPRDLFVAVWALVQKGMVTNDSYDALRRAVLCDFDPAEAGLDGTAGGRLSVRALVARTKRSPWVGRFSRIPVPSETLEARAARQALFLLRRYGIVGKAIADAEARAVPWPELEDALRRLELRGEVVRGLFVDGLGPYQVAIPDAVDDLRARRHQDTLALINACDPACPFGSIAPDADGRVARIPSTYLVLRGGEPLLLIEAFGRRIARLADASDDVLVAALATLRSWLLLPAPLRGVRTITVHTYGDHEAAAAEPLFKRAGFTRDFDRMILGAGGVFDPPAGPPT